MRAKLRRGNCVIAMLLLAQGCRMVGHRSVVHIRDGAEVDNSGNRLTVVTWNIGYAGLGEESDFILDHGEMWLPPSQGAVEKNEDGILGFLETGNRDIYLFQETAKYWVPGRKSRILDDVADGLERYTTHYSEVVRFSLPLLGIRMGNMLSSRVRPVRVERVDLPIQRDDVVGRAQKKNMLAAFIPGEGEKTWVIVNIHLSAFDENAEVRKKQLKAVKAYALRHYRHGHYVVVGGDWNMRLARTDWPHTTHEDDLFWIHDLPESWTPEGWQWGVDILRPTVRTNQKLYVDGENYTTIIDGFLVSPNVEIVKVETADLGFRYSDHNPVTIRVRARSDG